MAPSRNPLALMDTFVFGRWKTQTLYVAVSLGMFEALSATEPRSAEEIAKAIGSKVPDIVYRTLRAVSSLELLEETDDHKFTLNDDGAFFTSAHPQSLRYPLLLEEGPQHYAIWKHFREIAINGGKTGFAREYGKEMFEFLQDDQEYATVFQDSMTSYSRAESLILAQALKGDLQNAKTLCDVGGGYGYLMNELIKVAPHAQGTVFDLPVVIKNQAELNANTHITFTGGDFFKPESVPKEQDAYFMKHIIHDWDDEQSIAIYKSLRHAAKEGAKLYLLELVIPGPNAPGLAKILDMHMLLVASGAQRDREGHEKLLAAAGWRLEEVRDAVMSSIVVATAV